jgi:ABC-2 type transport system permease protein
MTAILDREIKAYFQSPLGYVFVGVMFLFTGYFFFAYNLYGNTTDMRGIFSTLFTVVLFLIPILTMRLMSEDKKLKTEQLLFTAPVTKPPWCWKVFGSGLRLPAVHHEHHGGGRCDLAAGGTGMAGDFRSFYRAVLTGNHPHRHLSFPVIPYGKPGHCSDRRIFGQLFLMLIDTIAPVISLEAVSRVLESLSFQNRYTSFTLGILNLTDIVFFLSIAVMFVCFTIGVLEKRRWS